MINPIMISRGLFFDKTIKSDAKFLYLYLAEKGGYSQNFTMPLKELMDATGFSKSHIGKLLNLLIAKRLIIRASGKGHSLSNSYKVLLIEE